MFPGFPQECLLSTAECGSKAVVGLIGDWGLRTRTGMMAPVAEETLVAKDISRGYCWNCALWDSFFFFLRRI